METSTWSGADLPAITVEPIPPPRVDRRALNRRLAQSDDFSTLQTLKLETMRSMGLKTDGDVDALLSWLRDPIVGTKHICTLDHVPPITFVRDVLLGRSQDYVLWANRAGSKSYLAGMITWIQSSFLPRLETTILGGSFEQSEKSYKAINDFWTATAVKDAWLAKEPMRKSTKWRNLSEVSVLTASQKSIRGPHPQHLVLDEIDEMELEVYEGALSQPQSKHGIPSSVGRLSTNHHVAGTMDMALAQADEMGLDVYKWCIWECLEPCVDYDCSTCKLTAYCPGKQMKEADGYYAISDFVKKLYNLSLNTLNVEWLCIKVDRSDLIYGVTFHKEVNSALDLPAFDPAMKVKLSIDWGGTNPFSVGVWQNFKKLGWVRVDEVYMPNTTNSRVIAECKTRPWWRMVDEGVGDPSRPDLRREWREEGIDIYNADNDVDKGIEATRDAMCPVLGSPSIYVNRKCRSWLREVDLYSEKGGKPVKAEDHAMDETRYFVLRYIKQGGGPRVRSTK